MDDMPPTPAHAKPVSRRDHLWVLVVIALCCLIKVWPSWVGIGAEAGFPKLGRMATDWTLAVVIEAYWAYAVYAWLAASAGRRSRLFAMWSAAAVFALSLLGQGAERLVPAAAMTVFANILPVIVLALIAVLVHLRQKDREDAAEAGERTAVQAEMDALRADAEALTVKLSAAETAHAGAEQRESEALAKVEVLTQKLARTSGRKPARKSTPKKTSASTPETTASSPPEVQVPEDVDTQAAALEILAKEPDISGSELGRRLGKSERYGCMLKRDLAGSAPGGN